MITLQNYYFHTFYVSELCVCVCAHVFSTDYLDLESHIKAIY